ncbi:unnamed protein product, partial [Darwinula stevensoni]
KNNYPGECPEIEAGICLEECSSHEDCRDSTICCFNGCGHICTPAATSCEEAWCPPEFDCVLSQIICDAMPGLCPEVTHCVPEGHVTCDDMTCVEGYHCIMQEMGCEDCYPYADCVPDILPKRPKIPDHLFRPPPPGTKMNLLQLMAGGRPLQPCSHEFFCDEAKNNYPGECPEIEAGICLEECSSHEDCRDSTICCFNGCGHICTPAATSCEEAWCPPEFDCVLSQIICDAMPGLCPEVTHCVPEGHVTCDDMTCVEGYHCIMQEMGCEDCYPYADCVPDILPKRPKIPDHLFRPPPPGTKMNLLQLMAGGRPLQPVDPRMFQGQKSIIDELAKESRAKFFERVKNKK